ncbi:thioesterase superfamily protein [Desulfobulbus propionicus DSM 2032]|uniref:Thioesterase superfamily protein n=1 Tax=Desulfobulbus propionicus (strain ATCC 33891 / DSM 2032 / VKM B-1956 / 1pr3) TaxID=577650 RepID=A0A7U4DN92_DESPD|nr:PaaI family thioesterase [Desulfobulbus propionicus]ADW16811.1 thioesterase superfamily protein [Desulfobulbus propionicus DSM 2032]
MKIVEESVLGRLPPAEVLRGHEHCLLCGTLHPRSWRLSFEPTKADEVRTFVVAGTELQGYDNIVHGGVLASLLDAAMTHWLLHHGIQAVTGDLRVRFLHPVACDTPLELRARLLFACPPLYHLQAEIRCGEQRMARGEGKFMRREQP